MKTSIEQISEIFRVYITDHKQLENYYDDIIEDFVAKNYEYPMMWADIPRARPRFEEGEMRIDIDCYFMDLVNNNLTKIISDQVLNASDMYVNFNDNEEEFGFYISNTSECTPFYYAYDDAVAGMKMRITIQVGESRDEKVIPK